MDPEQPDSQINEMDLQKRMEDECCRLQRQVRAIQVDRTQISMGVHPQFRRQDKLLKVLKREYLGLVRHMKTAKSGYHKKHDRKRKKQLKEQLLLREKMIQQEEVGLTVTDQLEQLLHREKKHTTILRKAVSTNMGQIKERREDSERRLVKTENRLETTNKRYNVIQYENCKIREEIESMLNDRMNFNREWAKMQNALNKGKKFLIDLFEASTLAYDQRDEWVGKLRSMQEKGRLDQMVQLQEMRDYRKLVDHEMKLYQFLARKGVIRRNTHVEERERLMKEKEIEDEQKQLDKHRKIIEDVTEYVGTEDIKKIIYLFQLKEQENFSIYKLMAEYCAENVMLEKNLKVMWQNVADRRDMNESREAIMDADLEALKKKLEEVQKRTEALRNRLEEKDQLGSRITSKIREMFDMLECSAEPFQNLLGDKQPSRWTFSMTMHLINEKIQEYLELVYYCEHYLKMPSKSQVQAKKARIGLPASSLKTYTVYPDLPECYDAIPVTQYVPSDPCPVCVESRWTSRVIDYMEVPFNKEMVNIALRELVHDPAYMRSDRVHTLTDCRAPASRVILANRYMR